MSDRTEELPMPDASPAIRDRPWAALAREMEAEHGHWSDFAAWLTWLGRALEAQAVPAGFDAGPLMETINDLDAEIGLYSLMCRLADGEPIAFPAPAEPLS